MQRKFYRIGLLGYPLTHSCSPQLHAAALRSLNLPGEYRLYPIAPGDQAGLVQLFTRLRAGELDGLNVTIPYKQAVIPWLDEISPIAQNIGAVNTIYARDGRLVGGNTDVPGFWADLGKYFPTHPGSLGAGNRAAEAQGKALVLGAGGAARAVVYALAMHGWHVTLAARRLDQAKKLVSTLTQVPGIFPPASALLEPGVLASCLDGTRLIVNATPLGMAPDVDRSPWPAGLPFLRMACCYDLVYNPRATLLLRQAGTAGLSTASGLGMLVEQAALSFEIWTGYSPIREAMWAAVEAI